MRAAGLDMDAKGWLILGAVVLVGGYVWYRGIGGAARNAANALVNAAGGAAEGTVLGVGDVLGIPQTSQSQCQADLAAGNTWAASFSCSAGDFIGSFFGGGGGQVDQTLTP